MREIEREDQGGREGLGESTKHLLWTNRMRRPRGRKERHTAFGALCRAASLGALAVWPTGAR